MKLPRDTAGFISRALISASNKSKSSKSSTRSIERTLQQLGYRSLTPSLVAQVIDPHLLHHPYLSLGLFNWAGKQPNFSHTSDTFHSVFRSLSVSNQFNLLEKVVKEAKSRNVAVHPSIYRPIVASCVKSKRTHDAYLLLTGAGTSVSDVGSDLCNKILAGLVSEGHFYSACKLFDEILVERVRLTTLGFGLFMWAYCRSSQPCQVLGVLDKVREVGVCGFHGSIILLLIIHGLCEVGRVSEAHGLLDELRNRDFSPDFMAYRVVAEAFKGLGCVSEVEMVLEKKEKLGFGPRANDYKEFILVLISENLLYEAKELGKIIIDGDFSIDDDLLNALIGSVSLVDPSEAVSFFKFMVGKKRVPTVHTLSDLSKNLRKNDRMDDLLDIFKTLFEMDYFTNLENYSVMFSSMCESGRVREAYAVLQETRKKGMNPDVMFYNVLMNVLCREDLLRPAKKLWDEMFACGIEANLETYDILVKKFVQTGQVDEAQVLFKHMLQKGLTPDASMYTSLLEGLCQGAKLDAAIQIFDKAVDQDVKIAKMMLNPLVLYLCKGGHFTSASAFLISNCHLGYPESHATLTKCLAEAKEAQIAINHLKQVLDISPKLLPKISTALLSSSSSNSYPILELLREIQQKESTCTDSYWKDFCTQLSAWIGEASDGLCPPRLDTTLGSFT